MGNFGVCEIYMSVSVKEGRDDAAHLVVYVSAFRVHKDERESVTCGHVLGQVHRQLSAVLSLHSALVNVHTKAPFHSPSSTRSPTSAPGHSAQAEGIPPSHSC